MLSQRVDDMISKLIETLMQNNSNLLHPQAFIHSDQGVHYTSPRFQKLLKKYKLGQSMSRRSNCLDNVPQESFFDHMKDKIDYKDCDTFEELQTMINICITIIISDVSGI